MNTNNNASSALLHYLDDLLLDTDSALSGKIGGSVATSSIENVGSVSGRITHPNILNLILFKVAGIPLALPRAIVHEVMDVVKCDLPTIVSRGGVIVRKYNYHGRDVHVLDMRDIIIPNGHPSRQGNRNGGNAHLLIVEGVDYGLMCDQVGEYVGVERADVEWRTQRSSRPWLAGMVKVYEHVLLDELEIIQAGDLLLNITNCK